MTCTVLSATGASGAFKDPGFLARPAGLGGAFVALADDPNTVWYNVAGLANVRHRGFICSYAKPYTGMEGVDMDMSFVSFFASVTPRSTIAVAWSQFRTIDLYQEDIAMVGYGYNLGPLVFGVAGKLMRTGVVTDVRTQDDAVFANGTARSVVSVDAGFFKKITRRFNAGMSVKNINQPDCGYASTDRIPMEMTGGVAYTLRLKKMKAVMPVSVAVSYRNEVVNIMGGTELWLRKRSVAVRCGGNFNEIAAGASYLYAIRPGLYLETHYAYTFPFKITGTSGSHRLSMGVRY